MVAFGIARVATLWLAAAVSASVFWFTIAMFVVAFVFTLPMALSQRGYMVGWVSLLWFFSIAPMTSSGGFDHVGPAKRGRYRRRNHSSVAGGYWTLRTSPST